MLASEALTALNESAPLELTPSEEMEVWKVWTALAAAPATTLSVCAHASRASLVSDARSKPH